VQLFIAIFIENCAKCRSVTKKRLYKSISVSSIFCDCMKKSYMTNWLRLNVIYHETVGLQARCFTTPANSALTFRDFLTRLKRLTLFRDFRRSMKMCEMNYLILFCKSYLVLFLTFIICTPISCFTTTCLGIFW